VLPVALGEAFGSAGDEHAGVIHQHVELAEPLERYIKDALYVIAVADVASKGNRGFADLMSRCFERLAAPPDQRDFAPSRAKAMAMARPMPEPAPVTMATL
jgi:hypothetical protein